MKWILQIIILSCAVLIPETSLTTYKAHENDDISIRWDTLSRSDLTRSDMVCVFLSNLNVLYERINGVESPDFQHRQFAERVRCNGDALREGRVVLHLSKVRVEDSGRYRCDLGAHYNTIRGKWETSAHEIFLLNVTTASKEENRVLSSGPASAAGAEDPPVRRRSRRRGNDPTGWGTPLAVVALTLLIVYGVYLFRSWFKSIHRQKHARSS